MKKRAAFTAKNISARDCEEAAEAAREVGDEKLRVAAECAARQIPVLTRSVKTVLAFLNEARS